MNLNDLQEKLLTAARSQTLPDQVPYAFERRIMARVQEGPPVDAWALWSQALWRCAAPCVALMLLIGTWSIFLATESSVDDGGSDLEVALFLPADDLDENW